MQGGVHKMSSECPAQASVVYTSAKITDDCYLSSKITEEIESMN